MTAKLRMILVVSGFTGALVLGEQRGAAFSYYVSDTTPIVWSGGESVRYLYPTTFPPGSDAEAAMLGSMGLWNIVPATDFAYFYSPLTEDPPTGIDHFDGFSDTAAVAASSLDPGVLAVTYLVNDDSDGTLWFDMDMLLSDYPLDVGWTLESNPSCDLLANPLPDNGFSFILVATHEMGHALGLGHQPFADAPPGTPWFIATMNPAYPAGGAVGQENIIEVHTDDRNGLRFLYPEMGTPEPPFADLANSNFAAGDTLGKAEPAAFSPTSVLPGELLTLQSVLENFGTTDETGVRQGFYLSIDGLIDTGDTLMGWLEWDMPYQGAIQFEVDAEVPDVAPGTHYVGSILDDLDAVVEVYEDNNAMVYCQTLTVGQLQPVVNSLDMETVPCSGWVTGPTATVTYPLNMSPVTWSLEGAPTGMVIDEITGAITWDEPIPSLAPYTVTVRADNAADFGTTSWQFDVVAGDFDGDAVITVADLEGFAACVTGPVASTDTGCTCSDLDDDGHVDLADYAVFQNTLTSPTP